MVKLLIILMSFIYLNSELLDMQLHFEKSRKYYVVDLNKKALRSNCIIFLHGLGANESNLKQEFEKIANYWKEESVVLVFPIGLKESFPESSDCLAWGPEQFEKNADFITSLMEKIGSQYPIKNFYLFGFSNGAYFSEEYLFSNYPQFDGYWIQGGGIQSPSAKIPQIKKKVILEVGTEDSWHLEGVRSLRNQFISSGWILGENFIYRELPTDHSLDLSNLYENYHFLYSNKLKVRECHQEALKFCSCDELQCS